MTRHRAPQAPPGVAVPLYRKALGVEACLPHARATHWAVAKGLNDSGVLDLSQCDAEALVRQWRAWPRHLTFVRHWRAWGGTL